MHNYYGTWTFFRREVKRFMKVYLQTLFAPVVSNLLFLAIFGLSVHGTVNGGNPTEYLQFLVPGLIIMGLINNGYQNPSSSLILMKYQGLISDLMTIPLRRGEIFFAFVMASVLRAFIVAFVTFLTSLLFVSFGNTIIWMIFLAAFIVTLFFTFLGFLVGMWAKEFDSQAFIQAFILTPLTFLGGVFYPVTALPELFQKISQINPIVYMIDLMRYGFIGKHEFSLTFSLSFTMGITILLGGFTYYLLRKGYKLQN